MSLSTVFTVYQYIRDKPTRFREHLYKLINNSSWSTAKVISDMADSRLVLIIPYSRNLSLIVYSGNDILTFIHSSYTSLAAYSTERMESYKP